MSLRKVLLDEGLPWWLSSKGLAFSAGDLGSIPGSGRSPGEYSGSPLQYSCLENPKDRGAWQAAVHGIANSQTQLSNNASLHVDENRKAAQNYILITLCLYS